MTKTWTIQQRKSGTYTIMRDGQLWRAGVPTLDEAQRRARALQAMLGGRIKEKTC